MKNLILPALDQAFARLMATSAPTTTETHMLSIADVDPLCLVDFMRDNKVPANAYFAGKSNDYDAYDDICIAWDTQVQMSTKDYHAWITKRFDRMAWKAVYDALIAAGHTRVGFDTQLLREYKDSTPYIMYMNGEIDRLVAYYSLYFSK